MCIHIILLFYPSHLMPVRTYAYACSLISECNGVEALSLVLDESNANCITFAAQCVSTMSTDG